jgi:hypothetical protein
MLFPSELMLFGLSDILVPSSGGSRIFVEATVVALISSRFAREYGLGL